MKSIIFTWFSLVVCSFGAGLPLAALGEKIFLDTSLSNPPGQGCVSCHNPENAFADPRRVSPGAVKGRLGRRNAPSLMYAALIPSQRLEDTYDDKGELEYIVEGGLFLDGRAHDLLDQVRHPFFDKNEMNIAGARELAEKIRNAYYEKEFEGLGEKEINEKTFEA
ncbi:cytochrome-c peroxidase, partial [Akkermansiaceae bacterium]|nr:cytochrome-c peroxidase [Akkermansiaceae bacterium]